MVIALAIMTAAFAVVPVSGVHASSAPIGIVVPLYSYPTSGSWTAVIQAKQAYPNVPVIVVVSPGSGPGGSQDANYVQGIKELQAAGIKVLGYVDTGYGSDSISSVEAKVDLWEAWYAPNGIFFDRMNNVPGYEGYYSSLGSYVHSLGMGTTMGNPGTSVPDSYVGTLDILNVFESGYLPALSFITYPGYAPTSFATMSYGVGLDSAFISGAQGLVSWVYLTDGTLPDPYSSLPSYFAAEFSLISSLDGASGGGSGTYSLSVNTLTQTGTPLVGLWTTWSQSGSILSTGFTPTSFSGSAGGEYTVTVSNYGSYVFCHWQDGSTNPTRSVSLQGDDALTAYYSTTGSCAPPTFPVTVSTLSTTGSPITGLYAAVTENGSPLLSGFSTLTFTATAGDSYGVTAENFGPYAFSHWADGSTNPTITIAPDQATDLVAYYSVGAIG